MRLVYIIFTLFLCSCMDQQQPIVSSTIPSLPVAQVPKANKFLALGDSYTIGESVAIDQRWPVQLVTELRSKGLEISDPDIIAKTGWRTDNLKSAIHASSFTKNYDLVSLLIGVNNQYQGKTPESYEPEFDELLQIAIEYAGGDKSKVIVLSIPDYGYTPFGEPRKMEISEDIDAFNEVNKRITQQVGITYVDITGISRKGFEQPDLVATDGLHPSGKMYAMWVQSILPHITLK